LEDWSSTNPPPGFSKTTSAQIANYSMNRGTENHTAGGQYSAQLTWTTTDNVDIAPLYQYPVTPGTAYTCSAWFLDNDPAGRARLAMSFQLSTGAVDTAYSTSYTADNASWTQQTYERVAPADAVSMTCLIRLYDVGTPFTSATIHFDDLSITP
jgi:hypothetical protein